SMDGKGRCLDNVWIERFWRTIKYDYLYLYEHKTTLELYKGIQSYLNFYNKHFNKVDEFSHFINFINSYA
ncbi:MAG: integrase core domain-containing protein, partial [Fusobacteriaceae bacterium]